LALGTFCFLPSHPTRARRCQRWGQHHQIDVEKKAYRLQSPPGMVGDRNAVVSLKTSQ
jgi:hypothetical protein